MTRRIVGSLAALSLALAALAAPAAAQMGGRLSVAPYVGYGFFGQLPDNIAEIKEAVAYGGRASYQFSDQFAFFGNFQRSDTERVDLVGGRDVTVDHWSAGIEFAYVPRGGAEGMLPVLLEAGLGQARYDGLGANDSDLAVNLGIASTLQLSPRFGFRYGANDYISNFDGRGVTNQVFVHVGAEVTF